MLFFGFCLGIFVLCLSLCLTGVCGMLLLIYSKHTF